MLDNIALEKCPHCKTKVQELDNFCRICGTPLNTNASKLKIQQTKRIKMELLDELANEIKDRDSLKVIVEKVKNL